MRIETAVVDEVLSEIEEVKHIEVGSEKHEKGVNSVTKLMDRAIEMQKVDLEKRKIEIEEDKLEVEKTKIEIEQKDRNRKDLIAVGTFIVSTLTGLAVVYETFRFDTENTPTSTLGRTILTKFVPKMFK